MKRIMFSSTNIPGCSTEFKLSFYEKEDSKAREEANNEEFKELENIVESGLADSRKKSHQYQKLIIKSEIGSRDSKKLLKHILKILELHQKRETIHTDYLNIINV